MTSLPFLFASLSALLPATIAPQQRAPVARPRAPLVEPFEIVACSLGCVRGPSGFSCTEVEIAVNQEVRITFNQAVDPASVNLNTFRLFDVTGASPPGTLMLDPEDASTLVYRPQMIFDSAGNPIFGLVDDRTYLLQVPGVDQDPLGPHIASVDGTPNRTRLLCLLVASAGVTDAVRGRPFAKLYVQAVIERDPVTGEPVRIARVPAAGATDVWRSSPIELVFDDLMNPATLANPVTGTSSFLRAFFDPDGDVTRAGDQVPIPGSFTIALDQVGLSTHVIFVADGGLPASGTQRRPGRVVFQISAQVADLAGNTVLNPGSTVFTTESR